MVRETWVQSQVVSYQRLLKWYLLNTQEYKVRFKGKVEQFKERRSALPYTSVAIKKGVFWSPSIKVANFTLLIYNHKLSLYENQM